MTQSFFKNIEPINPKKNIDKVAIFGVMDVKLIKAVIGAEINLV